MIVCPNCNHQNPDGAVQCEECCTPLPATTSCPGCGAPVQTDASFCGQCGFDLRANGGPIPPMNEEEAEAPLVAPTLPVPIPGLEPPDPLVKPEPLVMNSSPLPSSSSNPPTPIPPPTPPASAESEPTTEGGTMGTMIPPTLVSPPPGNAKTQLQQQMAKLLHVQTKTTIELPQNLSIVHMGKPNEQIPPDIDVSGFPHSEIVSRVHADIRVEGDAYYIEDVGSANGTYINHTPLASGNRHRLRSGDRISLGKGDLVTFLFQLS
jgi:pSer/pThr/pTyr-binding forkhead associated (FHA) protein